MRVEPFFFGPGDGLFGCVERPTGRARAAAVICPAFWHEYLLTHRAMRQLARHLADEAIATLRFDYAATGDSRPTDQPPTIDRWVTDAEHALDLVRERTGCDEATIIGVRGGGLVAWLAAGRTNVTRLALWNPTLDTRACVRQWQTTRRDYDRSVGRPAPAEPARIDDLFGYAVPRTWLDSFAAADPWSEPPSPDIECLLIESADQPDIARAEHLLRDRGAAVDRVVKPEDAPWATSDFNLRVPGQIVKRIAEWVAEGVAA